MKSLAIGLATVAVILAVFALFGSYAHADVKVWNLNTDQQEWTFDIRCTNESAEVLGFECQAAMMQVCPQGGTAQIVAHSEEAERPYWVHLKATCVPVL